MRRQRFNLHQHLNVLQRWSSTYICLDDSATQTIQAGPRVLTPLLGRDSQDRQRAHAAPCGRKCTVQLEVIKEPARRQETMLHL
jgi:hypothetical protein